MLLAPSVSLFCFASLLIISILSASAQQQSCVVDGIPYGCPTVTSSENRWGLEFRRYSSVRLVAYLNLSAIPPTETPLQAFSRQLPYLEDYFNGQNLNHTKVPFTRPVILEHFLNNGIEPVNWPWMILPDAYSANPPIPSNNCIHASVPSFQISVVVMSLPVPLTDELISVSVNQIQTVLTDHHYQYWPDKFRVVSYLTNDTKTWPNEIWLIPVDQQQPFLLNMGQHQSTIKE